MPVVRISHLKETQAGAFVIADNRLTDNSVWNDRLLAEAFKDLSEAELNFSIEATAIDGRLPRGIGITRLRDAPTEWSRQHALLGLAS